MWEVKIDSLENIVLFKMHSFIKCLGTMLHEIAIS